MFVYFEFEVLISILKILRERGKERQREREREIERKRERKRSGRIIV